MPPTHVPGTGCEFEMTMDGHDHEALKTQRKLPEPFFRPQNFRGTGPHAALRNKLFSYVNK